jgi:organic radical activating enzyme
MTGHIKEIFTSIQGEGIKVGQRQAFVRFLGCNLSCSYCDTPGSQKMAGPLLYEGKEYQNPVNVEFILERIDAGTVSISGGEPLLQSDFAQELCRALKEADKKVYLDTNGTLPDGLSQVIDLVDVVALDFKIPTATGRPAFWAQHEWMLDIAVKKEVFVKIVINDQFLPQELVKVCQIIQRVNKKIPLVIQPVFGKVLPNLLDIQKRALDYLTDVRIIPQVHKYLKLK